MIAATAHPPRRTGVLLAELEITKRCAMTCPSLCHAQAGPAGEHNGLTTADWLRVIDKVAAMAPEGRRNRVQFIGGDPLLHPGIVEMIGHALGLGLGLGVEVATTLHKVSSRMWTVLERPGVTVAVPYHIDITRMSDPAAFALYCEALRNGSFPFTRDRTGALIHRFWWVDGDRWLGQGSVCVNPAPTTGDAAECGDCRYVIRPSARRKGHGTALLRSLLSEAGRLGISPAVLWVAADNIPGIKVIEKCGGLPISETEGRVRYLAPADR